MSTTIYKKSSKDADIEIKRLQDRLMAEVTNNLYPQTAIEDNATAQKIVEILQTYGFKPCAQRGGNIPHYISVSSSYMLKNLTPDRVDLDTLFMNLSDTIKF